MVIVYLKEKGRVNEIHPIKNPGKKSIKGMVELFEKIIKRGKSIHFDFDSESLREKEIWNIARECAELKKMCEYLIKRNAALSRAFFYPGILQIPYFHPSSLAKNFVQTVKAQKYAVNILEDGTMEIFDGQSVMTVPVSNKSERDITKKQ